MKYFGWRKNVLPNVGTSKPAKDALGGSKCICEGHVKVGRMKGDKFLDFRNSWTTVLRGIILRMVLIGFLQMVLLCFWEFTRNDPGASMALGLLTILSMICVLGWATCKVIRLARQDTTAHNSPACMMYSDSASLNNWGFLYVQFNAKACFFGVPILIHTLTRGMLIGLGRGSGVAQAVTLIITESVFLIGFCVVTLHIDKKTNVFNISVTVIKLISSTFLLVFSNAFDQPASPSPSDHRAVLTHARARSPVSELSYSSSTTPPSHSAPGIYPDFLSHCGYFEET